MARARPRLRPLVLVPLLVALAGCTGQVVDTSFPPKPTPTTGVQEYTACGAPL
jgi:hypothetical protein